jgi:hypothetical protein
MWGQRSGSQILVEKCKGKRPLGRSRHRWEDNTKLDLEEVVCKDVDCNHVAQAVGSSEYSNEP